MPHPEPKRKPHKFKVPTWAQIVRMAGLAIVIYETLFENLDRPSLLIIAGGMMGLPEILKAQSNGRK